FARDERGSLRGSHVSEFKCRAFLSLLGERIRVAGISGRFLKLLKINHEYGKRRYGVRVALTRMSASPRRLPLKQSESVFERGDASFDEQRFASRLTFGKRLGDWNCLSRWKEKTVLVCEVLVRLLLVELPERKGFKERYEEFCPCEFDGSSAAAACFSRPGA